MLLFLILLSLAFNLLSFFLFRLLGSFLLIGTKRGLFKDDGIRIKTVLS